MDFDYCALVLDSAIDFQAEIAVAERPELIRDAVCSAAVEPTFDKGALFRHLHRVEKEYLQQKRQLYVLVSSWTITASTKMKGLRLGEVTISFARSKPARFDRSLFQKTIDQAVPYAAPAMLQVQARVMERTPVSAARGAFSPASALAKAETICSTRNAASSSESHAASIRPGLVVLILAYSRSAWSRWSRIRDRNTSWANKHSVRINVFIGDSTFTLLTSFCRCPIIWRLSCAFNLNRLFSIC
jgi:hypothetical protein